MMRLLFGYTLIHLISFIFYIDNPDIDVISGLKILSQQKLTHWPQTRISDIKGLATVDSEIFARILFSQIALKDI